jgi:hypothetical protein
MRAHGAVALILRALAMQVQVEIREQWRKSIRIVDSRLGAVPQMQTNPVRAGIAGRARQEQSLRLRLGHRTPHAAGFEVGGQRLGQEGSNLPAGLRFVGTEKAEGIAVIAAENGFDFVRSHRTAIMAGASDERDR